MRARATTDCNEDEPHYPRVVFDLGVEVTTRLMAVIKTIPAKDRRRYRPAAKRAARALEGSCPAVMGMTSNGMIAGLFAAIAPGRLSVVVASADDCIRFAPELRALPAAGADLEAFLAEDGQDLAAVRGNLPNCARCDLEGSILGFGGARRAVLRAGHRRLAEIVVRLRRDARLGGVAGQRQQGRGAHPHPPRADHARAGVEPEMAGSA